MLEPLQTNRTAWSMGLKPSGTANMAIMEEAESIWRGVTATPTAVTTLPHLMSLMRLSGVWSAKPPESVAVWDTES